MWKANANRRADAGPSMSILFFAAIFLFSLESESSAAACGVPAWASGLRIPSMDVMSAPKLRTILSRMRPSWKMDILQTSVCGNFRQSVEKAPVVAHTHIKLDRRHLIASLAVILNKVSDVDAAGLADRLKQRSSESLSKPLLPSLVVQPVQELTYPDWMEGTWEARSQFVGYELPVKKLDKKTIMADKSIAGFQKLSVVYVPDMGSPQRYPMRWKKNYKGAVTEDVKFNLASVIDNSLGYQAVQSVTYDAQKDAARASIVFEKSKTRNAERIELFVNSAESESLGDTYVCTQLFRQVTYSLSQQFGVARQEIGEYANFWTFEKKQDGSVRANLLTAAYLQPQDPLFFDAPSLPIVVYANEYLLTPLTQR